MRLVTFLNPQSVPEPGVLLDDHIVGLGASGFASMLELIQGGSDALARIRNVTAPAGTPAPVMKLLAPIPRPPKLICVGLNYRDHAEESNMAIPEVPTIFNKFPHCVIGPGDPIVLPKNSTKPDYEAEFAAVIGTGGRHIAKENWRSHVFGYTNLNDVSARDFQMATSQWLMGKTFDTFAPMGPALVTADEIPDPHNLDIRITINGEILQNSNTRNLIFQLPELIAYLSGVFTLEPGDVISTGTPGGVGFARKPPRWLKPGDDVVVEVQGLGQLRNPVVSET